MLNSLILELTHRLTKQRGFHTPFELVIKPELPRDGKDRERIVIIKAGNPPIIAISKLYIIACVAESQKMGILPSLRDTVERSLEFLPKMYHTLSLVPIAEAVALRKDSKKWVRATLGDNFRTTLDDRWFKVAYSVTVTDTLTNTSRTLSGDDIEEITRTAKQQLSNMIIQSEEMEEYRDNQERETMAKMKEIKPNEVSITIGDNRIETKVEY